MTTTQRASSRPTTDRASGDRTPGDRTPSQWITDEVGSWPGVEVDTGELGEVGFIFSTPGVRRRELGHVHGDHAAHYSFPRPLWHELRAEGRIEEHPVFPGKTGPAQRRLTTDADVRDAIELFRINYDRAVQRQTRADA